LITSNGIAIRPGVCVAARVLIQLSLVVNCS
jgi:hypothetical protein